MKLSEIAKVIGGTLIGDDLDFASIKSISTAEDTDLSILLDKKHLADAKTTKAKAIISFTKEVSPKNIVLVENTRKIFAKVLNLFDKPHNEVGISKMSSIDKTAKFGKKVFIDDFVKIGSNTQIADNVKLYSGVKIGANVLIGTNTIIYPNVVIYDNSVIGNNCILHSGCIIGADGFGFEINSAKEWDKVPQLAKVIIGNNVEIGANTCIDKGAIQDTIIGDGTKLDNLVQIGHNSQIGKNNVISASCAIAGSTVVGDNCMWAGQSATAGHLRIGNNVTIMGRAGVTKDIPDNEIIHGYPAQHFKKELKEQGYLRNLAKKALSKGKNSEVNE